MQTHDLGRAFVHAISLSEDAPRVHTAVTNEVDQPYRQSKSLVVRLWRSRGFVLGWWRHTDRTETQALMEAIGGREDTPLDEDGYLLPQYERDDAHVDL